MGEKVDYTSYPKSNLNTKCPKCGRLGIRHKNKKMESFTHKTEIVTMMGLKVSRPYDMCIV